MNGRQGGLGASRRPGPVPSGPYGEEPLSPIESQSSSMNMGGAGPSSGAQPNPYGNLGLPSQIGGVNLAGAGMIARMGLDYGSKILGSGVVQSSISRFASFDSLRYYFNVSNSYVLNKLKLVLLPVQHKGSWKRRRNEAVTPAEFLPPRDDVYAPDLYIPCMAFITYVLVVGFILGAGHRFTPEILGVTASTGLATIFLELAVLKLALYVTQSSASALPSLDLIAYCGYKFVPAVLAIIAGALFGTFAYTATALILGAFMAIFLMRIFNKALGGDSNRGAGVASSALNGSAEANSRRNSFLILASACQIVLVLFLSYGLSNH